MLHLCDQLSSVRVLAGIFLTISSNQSTGVATGSHATSMKAKRRL